MQWKKMPFNEKPFLGLCAQPTQGLLATNYMQHCNGHIWLGGNSTESINLQGNKKQKRRNWKLFHKLFGSIRICHVYDLHARDSEPWLPSRSTWKHLLCRRFVKFLIYCFPLKLIQKHQIINSVDKCLFGKKAKEEMRTENKLVFCFTHSWNGREKPKFYIIFGHRTSNVAGRVRSAVGRTREMILNF